MATRPASRSSGRSNSGFRSTLAAALLLLSPAGCAQRSSQPVDETSAEASQGHATPAWDVEIASSKEPGERLVLSGVVRDARGHPLAGAEIHAYHSDTHGNYGYEGGGPRLHRRFKSGPHGEYRIRTIMPGGSEGTPHVHFEVTAHGHGTQGLVVPLMAGWRDPEPPARPGADDFRPDRRLISSARGFGANPPAPTSPAIADSNGVRIVHTDLRLR